MAICQTYKFGTDRWTKGTCQSLPAHILAVTHHACIPSRDARQETSSFNMSVCIYIYIHTHIDIVYIYMIIYTYVYIVCID